MEEINYSKKSALEKLQVVELDRISIPSKHVHKQHIVNLRQSFTFPFTPKPSREIATQTSQMNLMSCRDQNAFQRPIKRPASLPPENAALANLGKLINPVTRSEQIGDGLYINEENSMTQRNSPDLELSTMKRQNDPQITPENKT